MHAAVGIERRLRSNLQRIDTEIQQIASQGSHDQPLELIRGYLEDIDDINGLRYR